MEDEADQAHALSRRLVAQRGGSLIGSKHLVPRHVSGGLRKGQALPPLEQPGAAQSLRKSAGAGTVAIWSKVPPAAPKQTLPTVQKPYAAPVAASAGKSALRGGRSDLPKNEQAPKTDEHAHADYAYIGLIHTLRQYPNTQDFVYLRRIDRNRSEYNPYALHVVPYSDATTKDFYTLSAHGITYYLSEVDSDFTSLDQWERQLQLFNALKKLRLWRMFRLWKGFRIWSKSVREGKIARCKAALRRDLFLLNPIFQRAMLTFNDLCSQLAARRLVELEPGRTYELEEFMQRQLEHQGACKEALEEFSAAALDCVMAACQASLDELKAQLVEFNEKQEESCAVDTDGLSTKQKIAIEQEQKQTRNDFAYTMFAAKRSRQRSIINFIRMADFMLGATLRSLLISSCETLVSTVESKMCDVTPEARITAPTTKDASDDVAGAMPEGESSAAGVEAPARPHDPGNPAAAAGQSAERPLFRVNVNIADDEAAELCLAPLADDFTDNVDRVMSNLVEVCCSVERMLENADLVEGVVGESDVEVSTPMRDLVVAEDHAEQCAAARELMEASRVSVTQYVQRYQPYRAMLLKNRQLDVGEMELLFRSGAVSAWEPPEGQEGTDPPDGWKPEPLVTLETFDRVMKELAAEAAQMQALEKLNDVGVMLVDITELKASLLPSPTGRLAELQAMLPKMAFSIFQAFAEEVHSATFALTKPDSEAAKYVEKLGALAALKADEAGLDARCHAIHSLYDLIADHAIPLPDFEAAAVATLQADFDALKNAIDEVEGMRDDNIAKFNHGLEQDFEALQKDVTEARNAAQHEMILDEATKQETVVAYLTEIKGRVEGLLLEQQRINRFQKEFRVPEAKSEDLGDTADECNLKLSLWTGSAEFAATCEAWRQTLFDALDLPAMEDTVGRFHKMCFKMERGLPPNRKVPRFREMIDTQRNILPVIQALSNKALKERHWQKIEGIIGKPLPRDKPEAFTLGFLLDLDVGQFRDEIAVASTEATQEQALEEMLAKINAKWAEIEFTCTPFKDSKDMVVLTAIDEVQVALEDSMVTMSSILSSRYVAGIRHEVERTEKALTLFGDTLDEWLAVQKNWMYLESIFSAPDIQRQLPGPAKAFQFVDKQFRQIMRAVKERPLALQAGTHPTYFETFQKANLTLEQIQKELEDYLTMKRMAFPRFYFLSNDELLEILAQTKNVQAVQPHMSKCFDGIKSLDFGDEPGSINIHAMNSAEGEKVALGNNLKARGGVETWLGNVEQEMQRSLAKWAKDGYRSYESEARSSWVLAQPAQLVLVVSQIFWVQGVLTAFHRGGAAMSEYYQVNLRNLSESTRLVRGELSKLHRKILAALITIDVHARDIVADLVRHAVADANDFNWQMQLRYSWDEAAGDVVVEQVTARFVYAYEYLGAQSRLVVTPMTDRCYMTLTGALHLKLGGAPAGPAGTGKTETTKDLGKALGVNCVVFNCGDNLDYRFMGKFFSGIAQAGAWACFDEFNRIDVEVLSVVAQQLLTIQNALKGGLKRFNFEGRDIRLVDTCGVFITMNPGYAGRTELPDNLKALFRPMAMMIPDYALVAEVMLFSEGFEDSKTLSRKMVKLYKLSSEQLSQADHYDFGMRALKSVLVMAGSLKRSSPDVIEDVVLIRAMRDSNLPKFLIDDAELFQNIIADLFPGVEVPANDYGDLATAIRWVLDDRRLQRPESFVLKVIQLFETLNVRFGVMTVGPTGGGKTTVLHSLQAAMTRMRVDIKSKNPEFQTTHVYTFNPKCIKMGELYGEYNLLTNEWTDGLGSTLIRNAVADATPDKKFVCFDGPVDAIWIENMNTVLDDNCTLCLPNGERIKLNPTTMRMLFEVQDLAVASPATVSRCGMVYVPPEELGWRPFVRTWLDTALPPEVPEACRALLWELFDTYVDRVLVWVRRRGKELIASVDNNLTTSMARIVQSLLHPRRGLVYKGADENAIKGAVKRVFLYALIWGLGGNLADSAHEEFDAFVRDATADICPLPGAGLCFEYFVDLTSQPAEIRSWKDAVPDFVYDKAVPYFSMLVPTVDTCRFSYLLDVCLDVERSVLFNGVTGVGKSVIIVDALERLAAKKNIVPYTINFSAQTSARDTQAIIEAKLEKKRKTRFGAPPGKRLVFFVDDVNMPARETYGAQPPVELLRQFQDFRGFYDRQKLFWKDIEDTTLCAACAPPGGGRQVVSPRFFRHFTMLCVPPPSDACTKTILSAIFRGFLLDFPSDFRDLCDPIVNSSVEAYTRISEELLPTPAKSHYTFNLRDLSKVFQGLLMIAPQNAKEKEVLMRLWAHESMRVFHDRLTDNEDKTYFKRMLAELVSQKFSMPATYEELFVDRLIVFGDFMKMGLDACDRSYEEVPDYSRLTALLEEYLEEYNATHASQLKLVFFQDAVEHVTRISRILRQPRGNAMLVGVGGSGKQSLTRFAAHMGGFKCVSIELARNYGVPEFREDLKKLYRQAGVDGKSTVFLFSDTQIVSEAFLEDINNMLNSGEVPGMFAADEKDRIAADVREWVDRQGLSTSKEGCYGAFINRVRDNLHVVLAMSPVGDAFRSRCRQFPSLINCCTIDWYTEWPEEALTSVAQKFMKSVDIPDESVKAALCTMCVSIHTSVSRASEAFFNELRRKYYTTPKSYLDLIALYVSLLQEKRTELNEARDRLLNGLNKLNDTNQVVDSMKAELGELQPILNQKAEATAALLEVVARDQAEAEKVKAVVSVEAQDVEKFQREVQAIADDAKADLAEALPILEGAVKSLNALNKNDIVEIKSFSKPPSLVQMTMEAVCTLKQEKADWDTAKKILSDTNFMESLKAFDKENIPDAVMKKLKKYIDHPDFQPETVAKQSKAAMSLCLWVRAMDRFHIVNKVVEPKKAKLRQAEKELSAANEQLKKKTDSLQEVIDRVEGLQRQLADAQQEQKDLNDQADLTKKRLERAGKLTTALGDEGVRWQQSADKLAADVELLVGDVFISAACIAYYGAFTGPYRQALVGQWSAQCAELGVPVTQGVTLKGCLASPVELREWIMWGLPTDDVSIDNGILVKRGQRWPLMIDPQGQANAWVKNMEAKNGLRAIKLTDSTFLRTLENSIRVGSPVLIEDIGEALDPALEPLLTRAIFTAGGRTLIRLGDSDVDYDPNFKFYITTKMANPHYLPDVCIKVTVINFTVTMKGLEDQLLGDVVRRERPDLEEAKDRLVVSISNDKRQLKDLEDKILKLLKESHGNILDDADLINTLNNSKVTSGMIQGRVKEAEVTERSINETRENYRPAATRGSILYFVIADLALVSPMYQYSLLFFSRLFNACIDQSEKSSDVPERLLNLSTYATTFIYNNVQRGLFEEHKLIFSFLLTTAIRRHESSGPVISEAEWSYLVRGPTGVVAAEDPPPVDWMTKKMWDDVTHIDSAIPPLQGLAQHIAGNLDAWSRWAEAPEPQDAPLPGEWEARAAGFLRLVVMKALREEKLLFGVAKYVGEQQGADFKEPRPWRLEDVFPDTNARSPVIFVLSTGADPTAMLQRFADAKGWSPGERLHMISLGQGQGPVAEIMIDQARKAGDWVCLQNCHVASSWMLRLEAIVEEIGRATSGVHDDFRLWLTSMPTPSFPVLVLQNGLKLTNEPPKGVKANINRSFNDMSSATFEGLSAKLGPWKKLLFSLSFFHAVVQERRKFGPIGWNIRYEFNQSDLECSQMTLRMFLEEKERIPWAALEYVVGHINYGGRVTDDNDRRCLMSVLRRHISPAVLDDGYCYTPSGTYRCPATAASGLQDVREYIAGLPLAEAPEVFGMHANANIKFQLQETRKLLDAVLAIQPRVTGTVSGRSPEAVVLDMAARLLEQVPQEMKLSDAVAGLFDRTATGQLNSLSVVLSQEIDRFNKLTSQMRGTLVELQKAIKGLVVMTDTLELMFQSLLCNQVPAIWAKVAFPSLKPLAAWFQDYLRRVTMMSAWLTTGAPKCFWLPGFFFPQGFMTGVLQMHARKYSIAIDSLNFEFRMTAFDSADRVLDGPEDGIFVDGLWIDGARWNGDKGLLDDALPGTMYAPLPVVHFNPAKDYEFPPGEYACPLYKTSVRAGILSTTGQSTNFVLYVSLPIKEGSTEDYWILQGVALLCMLDD